MKDKKKMSNKKGKIKSDHLVNKHTEKIKGKVTKIITKQNNYKRPEQKL